MIIFLLIIAVVLIILMTAKWNIHPFLALISASLFFALFSGMSLLEIIENINNGFGNTLGKIGLVILLGVIIGAFMERSGGAYRLADEILKLIGSKRVYSVMGSVGFIVSISVYADSGFIILSALNKSLSKKIGVSIVGTSTVLMLGLLITHVLTPPTPGPIAAAGIIGVDVGLVLLVGLIIGILSLIVAIIYSKKVASRVYIDPNPELSEDEVQKIIDKAPGVVKSFLPILIPICLIIGKSLIAFNVTETSSMLPWLDIINFLGTPIIALIIGVLIALTLPKKFDREMLSTTGWVGKALTEASNIILITGAGGIFGTVLQNSGIAVTMADIISGTNLGIWLPFILCAAIKTAQGSSTVAIITTASIIAPLLSTMGFETELQKALVVAAIGAGGLVVSHSNDSGFWVMTQFSGIDIKTGYRVFTTGSFVVGSSAAIFIYIASLFI